MHDYLTYRGVPARHGDLVRQQQQRRREHYEAVSRAWAERRRQCFRERSMRAQLEKDAVAEADC